MYRGLGLFLHMMKSVRKEKNSPIINTARIDNTLVRPLLNSLLSLKNSIIIRTVIIIPIIAIEICKYQIFIILEYSRIDSLI